MKSLLLISIGFLKLLKRSGPAVLLVCTAILYLHGLGQVGLFDSAEGIYAEVAREMLVLRDWVTPHFNFVRYFEKPPLSYWMNAASFGLLGVSEFAARLSTAVAAIVGVGIWRDAVPTVDGERVHLSAPHQTDARPAVEEDHQRSAGRPALDIARRLTRRAERI